MPKSDTAITPVTVPFCVSWIVHFGMTLLAWVAAKYWLGNRVEALAVIGPMFLAWPVYGKIYWRWRFGIALSLFPLFGLWAWKSYSQSVQFLGGTMIVSEWFVMSYAACSGIIVLIFLLVVIFRFRDVLISEFKGAKYGIANAMFYALFLPCFLLVWTIAGTSVVNIHRIKVSNMMTPADLVPALPYEELDLKTQDGISIAAWYLPRKEAKGAIVVCHGIGAFKSDLLPIIECFYENGWTVIAPDLRSHGDSGGHTVYFGAREWQEIAVCVDYLQERGFSEDHIVGAGYSLGCSAMLHALDHGVPMQALLLDSPFASLSTMSLQSLPPSWRHEPLQTFLLKAFSAWGYFDLGMGIDDISPLRLVDHLHVPVLCYHGTEDKVIPPSESDMLIKEYAGPKKRIVVPGASHIQSHIVLREAYETNVLEFFSSHIE